MRKIVSGLFISLDNVYEAPDKWHFPYFNDEMSQAVQSQIEQADTALFGRQTFEEFASYWPQQTDEFASFINNIPKYVVSNTLESTDWENSTIIKGDVEAELRRLKEQPGKNISITGSGMLVRWLLNVGLLDELRLLIHPIAVNSGKRLFDQGGDRIPLELVESEIFSTGVLYLTYRRAAPGTNNDTSGDA